MRLRDANSNDAIAAETAARASFLRMTPSKWRLVRSFEAIVRFFLRLMPAPQVVKHSSARPDRILVIEYWSMGDLAIVVPFLRNLRRRFPSAHISLLINADLPRFLEGQGIVDEFIPVRVPWARHFSRWRKYNPISLDWISLIHAILELRKRRFDWAFSGRMDVRDNLMLWLSGAPRRIGYGLGGGGCFLTDRVMPDLSRPHRADIWLHLLEAVGGPPDSRLGGFRLTDAELALARSHLAGLGITPDTFLIGVHPGARVAVRRWGDDRFAEVVRRILAETDAHVLWFAEPGNSCQAPNLEHCHPVTLGLRSFLAVLSHCRLLLGNDSGPMHLANLLGVPVVAVFGSQRPEWFGPRNPYDRVVIRPEFSCRPCFDYCIFDQPYCLRTISIDEVHNAVTNSLQCIRTRTLSTRTLKGAEAGFQTDGAPHLQIAVDNKGTALCDSIQRSNL
jgi:ADP-heptose:LPS heptosyltransferase